MLHSIPSYLLKAPSGIYYFRIRIPISLRAVIARKEIRVSLRTGNLRHAAIAAATLRVRYHAAFSAFTPEMGMDEERRRQLLKSLGFNRENIGTFEIGYFPDGRIQHAKSDGTEADGQLLLEALKLHAVPIRSTAPAPETKPVPLFSEAIAQFLEEKFTPRVNTQKPERGWDSDKARVERPPQMRTLLEIVGDRPVTEIDRLVMEAAWETLQMLPPNWRKSPATRDKKIMEIVEAQTAALEKFKAANAKTRTKAERAKIDRNKYVRFLSESTCNNYAWTWSEFFRWAKPKGLATGQHAEGLSLERDVTRSFRRSFTTEELKKIFESDFYKRHEYEDAYQYFVPLLMLYSGGRLNEFCQLCVEDVVIHDNIPCILIWDDEFARQRLKNQESRRRIPVHSKLVAAGFLDYVETMRKAGSEKLFPLLDTGGEKHSKRAGNWFNRFLSVLKVKERGIDNHSFRHTAIRVWYNANVEEKWAASICGQGYPERVSTDASTVPWDGVVTFSVYAGLPAPQTLQRYVEMLDFGITHPPFKMPAPRRPLLKRKTR